MPKLAYYIGGLLVGLVGCQGNPERNPKGPAVPEEAPYVPTENREEDNRPRKEEPPLPPSEAEKLAQQLEELLQKYWPDGVNSKNKKGWTPLQVATSGPQCECLEGKKFFDPSLCMPLLKKLLGNPELEVNREGA